MNQHSSLNRFYRLVWSVATQSWHVASEITRSRGRGGARAAVSAGALPAVALALSVGLAHGQQAPPASLQLPTGGTVSAGQAAVSSQVQGASAHMTVQQSSARAVLNWNSFNVGQNATVTFQQPSASAVTLNKVSDPNPSQIFGRIQSNGQVWLSNPAGIYFSPTARVDVGALVATTHTLRDADFMAGQAQWQRQGATGSVVNEGTIETALAGYVALLAPQVRNAGVVLARAGTVAMASGEMISLQFDARQSLTGITTTPSEVASLIENRLAVEAPDGQILLSAVALDRLQGAVIRNSGRLQANSLSSQGGKIVLEADQIELTSGSSLQANGATGGGTVLVGGDWQGSGSVRPAMQVNMASGASIEANALVQGDGGKVVLWSDVPHPQSLTEAHGQISAQGGAQSGNGGWVETSGHKLRVGGIRVSTAAPRGTPGLWLLDPDTITIAPSGGDITGADLSTNLASGSVNIQTNVNFMGSGWLVNAPGMVNIYPTNNSTIASQQSCNTCDIIINDNISWTNPSSALVFNAGGVIYGTGNITVGGTITGSPSYWGGPYTVQGIPSPQSIGALIRFNQNGDSVARGVSYSGSISGTITQTSGNYTFTASPPIEFSGEGGKFVMSGASPIASPRVTVNKDGSLIFTGSGGFTSPDTVYTLGDWQSSQAGHTGTLDFSGTSSNLSVKSISTQGAGASQVVMGANSLTFVLSSSSTYAAYGYDPSTSSSGVVFNDFGGVISGTGGVNVLMPTYMPSNFT
jgi:filamentous hemagglutinin family protein